MSKVKVITYFSVDEDKIRTFLMGMQLDMNDNTDGQFIGYEVTSITEDEIINEKAISLTKIIEEQEASNVS